MAQKRANPAGEGGALDCHAERLDGTEHTQNRRALQDSAEIGSARWERQIERLHRLGPRAVAELLAALAAATGQHVRVVGLVEEYAQLDRAVLRAVGGDRFPPMPLELVR